MTPDPGSRAAPRARGRFALEKGRLSRLAILAAIAGTCGALAAMTRGSAPRDLGELARALGRASAGEVSPDDVRWEPSRGALADATAGRWLLFLSKSGDQGTRDVWRARVRVSPEGHVIDVVEAFDLTQTPLGDDHALVVRGDRAAFATTAYGQVQAITLLDLAGEGAQNRATTSSERAMAWVTNTQKTGTGAGVARYDVTLEQPAKDVGLALGDDELTIDLADEATRRRAVMDVRDGTLTTSGPGMHEEPAMHLPKRLSHWAVDTVRAVSWIGPEPIAWLEDHVFALKDEAKRLAFRAKGSSPEDQLAAGATPPPQVLDTSEASVEAAHWPPPKIASMWKEPEAGEGEWSVPTEAAWIRKVPGLAEGAPAPFMTTFVRPDEERPYSKVLLVAMDMRQLDVDMEAGSEDPQPLTGPNGPGKLPRDPAITSRVVACFNGAFKTEHGHYGMMVHKRVLLPPQPGAATVITTKDGRVGLGSWGNTNKVTGLVGVDDDDIVSFRQNLDALVDHGQENPNKRSLWGYSAPGKGIQTERSGLCVTTSGHLVYGWGEDVSAPMLAKAMKMAGCDYAMHLDMNPYHTGFLFTNITNLEKKQYKAELLTSGMEIPTARYIEWAPKDFFYVMTHDPTPDAVEGATAWRADAGTQPAPSWMPGIWDTQLETSGGEVELLDVEAGRARWRVRAGVKESPGTSPSRELADDDKKRALFAVSLGIAAEKRARGLATDGRLAVPMHGGEGSGAIVVAADGSMEIAKASEVTAAPQGGDVVELPLVLDGGRVLAATSGAKELRAALGTTADGRVVLARGLVGSDQPLAEALKRAGCTRAVALDRGAATQAWFLHRAGTAAAPHVRYDDSVLWAIATPLAPRGFRFEAAEQVAANKK